VSNKAILAGWNWSEGEVTIDVVRRRRPGEETKVAIHVWRDEESNRPPESLLLTYGQAVAVHDMLRKMQEAK